MANQFTDDFILLFSHLVSNSNPLRASAEEVLLCLSENHPDFLCFKTSLLLCSPLDDMRFISAILLRQFFTPSSDFYLWPRLSPFCQFYLRVNLLLSLEEEQVRRVANAKGDTIAELASHLVHLYPQYSELLRFVLVSIAKTKPQILVEANLRVFSQITKPMVNNLVPLIRNLRSVLFACITYPTSSSDVRLAALSASCSLVQALPPSKKRNELRTLLTFRYLIKTTLHPKNPMAVSKVLQLLIDFAGAGPNFFLSFIQDEHIVSSLVPLAVNDLLENGIGYLALEFAITHAEAKKPDTGILMEMQCTVPDLLLILLEMLSTVDDNMAWLTAQPENQEQNQSYKYTVALEYLNWLVPAQGGNTVLEVAVDILSHYLIHPDWKKQHAAFIALARISEGCYEASAAKALTKFIEKFNDGIPILIPDLDEIVVKLILLLKSGKQMVQKGAVSALTNVAEAVSYNKYFDAVMPQLLYTLMNAPDNINKMLCAKLIDCISMFGLYAGKDKCAKHAHEVMGLLIPLQSVLDPDDPATNYVLRATGTICRCLDRDFLPHMDAIIINLLKFVQLRPDYGIYSAYSIDDIQYFDDVGQEVSHAIYLTRKGIRLGNNLFERKVLACSIVLTYIEVLKEHFLPWAEKVMLALAPLIRSKYHVEVRKASARSWSLCVLSAGQLKSYQIRNIVEEIRYLITSYDTRRRKRDKIKPEHCHSEEALINKENALEEKSFGHMSMCLMILIQTHGAAFLDLFHHLSKDIIPTLVSNESIKKRMISTLFLNCLADTCEHKAVRYYDEYLHYFLVGCNDADPTTRQLGLIGIGRCAEFGGSEFQPFLTKALAMINNVIENPIALKPIYVRTYGVALVALGKICIFHKFRTRAEAIAMWLNCLPIRDDINSAVVAHDLLCSMVESSDKQLLGDDNTCLVKIISLIIEILSSRNLVTVETQ